MYSATKFGHVIEESRTERYDSILIADCLWMPSQHVNLTKTVVQYLDENGCALVVAGFHTGRGTVANFFAVVPEAEHGLRIEEIFEIDVEGNRREWCDKREGETRDSAKRWCVCAVLVQR